MRSIFNLDYATFGFAASLILSQLTGCQATPDNSTRVVKIDTDSSDRDTDRAKSETARGVDLIDKGDYAAAETRLRRAVAADDRYGPAHNNLGVVLLHKSDLPAAAEQFRLAIALLPSAADPRNNLGLVLESGGRYDDAIAYFDRAAVLSPADPDFPANTARARVERGDHGLDIKDLLAKIAATDPRPDWSAWARETLNRMKSPKTDPAPP